MGSFPIGFFYFMVLVIFVLPPVLVLGSSRARGYDKFCWSLVSFFLSWLGFMFFLITHSSRPVTTREG